MIDKLGGERERRGGAGNVWVAFFRLVHSHIMKGDGSGPRLALVVAGSLLWIR